MTTTFQPQSHKVVSYQHPITCVETLSVRFPALCPLLHNRPIERKVHASELNVVDETVALLSFGKEKTTGAPNENIVQNHLNIELLNVF